MTATTQTVPRRIANSSIPAPCGWQLHVLCSPDLTQVGRPQTLRPGTTVIGREPGSQTSATHYLPIADSALSRSHAAILLRDGNETFEVEDLGSRNGTALNGRPVAGRATGQHGSVLRCGQIVAVVEMQPTANASQPTEAIAGLSAAAQTMRAAIAATAVDARPVAIFGETGAGKERVAEAVHRASGRRGPLVRVNVAAVPDSLFEAEFFGHAKGAFSGAGEARAGWVQQAHGGTLVLDEMGELNLSLQAKLLRVLEDRALRPLGARADVAIDVRFVASTNADLAARAQAGTFRADLLARLRAHEIVLSPLRDRRPDLASLADLVVPLPAGRHWHANWTADAAEVLALYDWPDNLRELDRVFRKLALLPRVVDVGDLPLALVEAVNRAARAPAAVSPVPDREAPTREVLLETLRDCGGNVERAARELGRDRKQLYRWMQLHGVDAQMLAGFRERVG